MSPSLVRASLVSFGLAAALAAQVRLENFTFTADKLGGGTLRAEEFADNTLLVVLWGSWCPQSRLLVPRLQGLYAKYKHHGLEVVGFAYESGKLTEQFAAARTFAAEHGITYDLALGDPALQRQIPGARGYPTLLYFGKGLKFEKLETGFAAERAIEIERWVAAQLGLPVPEAPTPTPPAAEEEGEQALEEVVIEEDVEVPPGAIYKPGTADTGFDFEATDVDGAVLRFKDLRGKPVVLGLTTTWDGEAENTAKLLDRVRRELGDDAHVIAASFERSKDAAVNAVAIKEFMRKVGVEYRAFPAPLGLQKKIWLFTGVPLFLVFDAEGRLVLREDGGPADELAGKILGAAR